MVLNYNIYSIHYNEIIYMQHLTPSLFWRPKILENKFSWLLG